MAREDDSAKFGAGEDTRGASARGDARPFTHAEMVACDECLRANAPTRMNCLYCGARLPADERTAALRRPALRKLEEWERGFNVVLRPPRAKVGPETFEEVAPLLRLEAERLAEIIEAGAALPVARASTEEEAALIVERLAACGLAAEVFADESLSKPPARVRSLAFEADALVLSSGAEAEAARVAWGDVALLVAGRLVTRRVEFEERPSGLGGRGKLVDAREVASDEAVLDIHARGAGAEAFRVTADNFDYSCLGEGKGLLAWENFGRLVAELRARATRAEFDEEYARLRGALACVWPPAERNESGGLRRDRPGKLNTASATVVTNEAQFTRYSRLRMLLAPRGRAEGL